MKNYLLKSLLLALTFGLLAQPTTMSAMKSKYLIWGGIALATTAVAAALWYICSPSKKNPSNDTNLKPTEYDPQSLKRKNIDLEQEIIFDNTGIAIAIKAQFKRNNMILIIISESSKIEFVFQDRRPNFPTSIRKTILNAQLNAQLNNIEINSLKTSLQNTDRQKLLEDVLSMKRIFPWQ